MNARDNGAVNEELWWCFIGWLLKQRDGRNDDVSALGHYAYRGTCHARRAYGGRDLFDGVRRDWGHRLGERAIRQAVDEFMAWLWARATGADGWRSKQKAEPQ